MYIVLQDRQGRAQGHLAVTAEGGTLFLRRPCVGEAVLLSQTGVRWGLDTPCPFAPAGAVVAAGDKILCLGRAPGQTISLEAVENLYRHPPAKEEPEPAAQTDTARTEAEPEVQASLSDVEEARSAAAVFAALAEEAGQTFLELEGSQPPASQAPRGGERWMEDTRALLSGVEKKPPTRGSEAECVVQNPFPHAFPGAKLHRVRGRGVLEYLEGTWSKQGQTYRLTAVPGAPSLRPPRHLPGFTRYISTGQGGYWVKLSPLF